MESESDKMRKKEAEGDKKKDAEVERKRDMDTEGIVQSEEEGTHMFQQLNTLHEPGWDKGRSKVKKSKCVEATYRKFLTVDDDTSLLAALPTMDNDGEDSHDIKENIRQSGGFCNYLKKKLLSPINERRATLAMCKTVCDSKAKYEWKADKGNEKCVNIRPCDEKYVDIGTCDDKCVGHRPQHDSLNDTVCEIADTIDASEVPHISKMMKNLLFESNTADHQFKTINPLNNERKINCNPNITLGKSEKKSFHDSSTLSGLNIWIFGGQIGSNKRNKRASSECGTERQSNLRNDLEQGKHFDEDNDRSMWDDVCYTPRHDRRAKARAIAFRRNSSPEARCNTVRPAKAGIASIFDLFKDKQVGLKCKGESRTLYRESSEPKFSSLFSLPGSKKGTPKLSRESSLASKSGSSGSGSPFESKRGKPFLDRENSIESPLLTGERQPSMYSEGNRDARGISNFTTHNLCRGRSESAHANTKQMSQLKKMTKGMSLTELEDQMEKPTSKLNRHKSTPKLKWPRECKNDNMKHKVSDPEQTRKNKWSSSRSLPSQQYRRSWSNGHCEGDRMDEDGTVRRQSFHTSKSCIRRSLSENRATPRQQRKRKKEIDNNSRQNKAENISCKSRCDAYQISIDDKIERWLENISFVCYYLVFFRNNFCLNFSISLRDICFDIRWPPLLSTNNLFHMVLDHGRCHFLFLSL